MMKKCFNAIEKLSNGLYYLFWKDKNFISKTIFIAIPFVIMAVFAIMIDISGVAHIQKDGLKIYSFLDDYANTYVVFGVFFFVYFARGLFIPYMEKTVDGFKPYINKTVFETIIKKRKMFISIITLLSLLFISFAAMFIGAAGNQQENNWYYYFGNQRILFYYFLIAYCWILCSSLFMHIIYYCYCLSEFLNKPLTNINYYNYDKCCGFRNTINLLAACMGFGVYFLIHVALMTYSDFRAHNIYNIDFLLYKYRYCILIITILLASFYFTAIFSAYNKLKLRLKESVCKKVSKVKPFSQESDFLSKIKITFFSIKNTLTFFSTFAIPAITAIITILQGKK